MPNPQLEEWIDNLRHRLRFLPEAECEPELAELHNHLAERVALYESGGETPAKAFHAALEKFGDIDSYIKQLRYRHYVLTPLKTIWFGIYRGAREARFTLPFGALGYGLLSWLTSHSINALSLLSIAPIMSVIDVSYLLDTKRPAYKHWGILGVILLWMSITFLATWLSLPAERSLSNLHMVWINLPVWIGAAYIRFPWRKNAKPTI